MSRLGISFQNLPKYIFFGKNLEFFQFLKFLWYWSIYNAKIHFLSKLCLKILISKEVLCHFLFLPIHKKAVTFLVHSYSLNFAIWCLRRCTYKIHKLLRLYKNIFQCVKLKTWWWCKIIPSPSPRDRVKDTNNRAQSN